ncbi:TetR/AcrR family transcriptional regulator [Streptococcus castoreus]|uniref:TetR/AcrR family transcriptional regulator n=1 Tax=Streptococcus castoreus TaxID=254786 RepID=UPI00040AE040|nr:TetR/AcrR family transcriptional regulator [Streptococcus castoreus]
MSNSNNIDLKLLRAFSELLTSKGIEQITVSDIAKQAQLSRRVFYNYYNSKEDFLRESILIILDEITKILNTDLLFEYSVLQSVLEFLYSNQEIIQPFVIHFPDIKRIVKNYIKEMVVNSDIPNLSEQLEEAYHIPYYYALDIYVLTVASIIFNWINNNFKEPPEEIARFIDRVTRI